MCHRMHPVAPYTSTPKSLLSLHSLSQHCRSQVEWRQVQACYPFLLACSGSITHLNDLNEIAPCHLPPTARATGAQRANGHQETETRVGSLSTLIRNKAEIVLPRGRAGSRARPPRLGICTSRGPSNKLARGVFTSPDWILCDCISRYIKKTSCHGRDAFVCLNVVAKISSIT